MPFDALTMAAVRHELQQKIVGGRVQNIIVPGPLAVSLEIYRAGVGRNRLILSAHSQHARVHLTDTAPSRDPNQHPPLLLLLRKYVKGGTIMAVSQPRFERVLTLSIAKRLYPDKHQEYHSEGDFRDTDDDELEEDFPDNTVPLHTVELVVEVMSRVSNIILVDDDGTVMDSIKRVPSSINRYRTVLPHHPYVPPPAQDKRDPTRTTINAISLEIARATESDPNIPAWKGLVSGYAALSPTLAREVVYRALGNTKASAADVARQPAMLIPIHEELQAIFHTELSRAWRPTVAWKKTDEEKKPIDFAPYPLTHLQANGAELQQCGGISEAASLYFAGVQSLGGHTALKAIIAGDLNDMRSREERKLFSLREEWQRAQGLETLRRKGELLLAFMHTLQPGQTTLTIPDEKLTIDLDPSMTPVENSQAIFKEYRRQRAAVEGLPERIEEVELRVAYLDDLLTSLDLASNYDEIKAVQAEVKQAGRPSTQQPDSANKPKPKGRVRPGQPKLPQPLRIFTRNGVQILLGRTAGQNDTATFRLAGPDDLWFHAVGAPGAHVILRAAPNQTQEDIEEAARLAAGYSKRREDAQVDVVYTEKKHVRKIPNAPPGQAIYKNERVIRVTPLRQATRTATVEKGTSYVNPTE